MWKRYHSALLRQLEKIHSSTKLRHTLTLTAYNTHPAVKSGGKNRKNEKQNNMRLCRSCSPLPRTEIVCLRIFARLAKKYVCVYLRVHAKTQTNTHVQLCTISRLAYPSLRVQPLV